MTKKLLLLIFTLAYFTTYSQIWEAVSDSPYTSDHSINFALNGMGYSVGGNINGNSSDQFYSYDPVSDVWTELTDYPGPARGFGIGDTYDGKAYIGFGVNGNNQALDDLWVYDPDLDTWTELASCPCTARYHPAFVINNGKIFMGMGGSPNGNLKDWWEYDIATDTWLEKQTFPGLSRHHPYQFAIGDYVYAGFGHGNNAIYKDWYRFDPVANSWSSMASLPGEGRVAGTQFSHNGKGYILSGDGDNHSFMDTGEFWEYDADLNSWTELPPHPGTSRWAPSSFLIDGYVYFMTGLSQSLVEDVAVWKYFLDGTPPVSTNDLENTELIISPNPSTDIVSVKLKETNSTIKNISLINLNGQLVLEQTKLNDNSITVNIENLPVGIYVLKVNLEDEVISQKIVKQ